MCRHRLYILLFLNVHQHTIKYVLQLQLRTARNPVQLIKTDVTAEVLELRGRRIKLLLFSSPPFFYFFQKNFLLRPYRQVLGSMPVFVRTKKKKNNVCIFTHCGTETERDTSQRDICIVINNCRPRRQKKKKNPIVLSTRSI